MVDARPAGSELLEHVRELSAAGDHAEIVHIVDELAHDTLMADPELAYHAAYALRRTGRTDVALALVQEMEIIVQRRAESWLIRRRLNLEAMLRFDRGDLVPAEQLWWRVVDIASRDRDYVLLGAAHNNLGVIHTLNDRMDDALATYNRALVAALRLGDRRGVAQAHQNLGILYRERSNRDESEAHFQSAMKQARESRSEDVLGRAEEERALLLLDAGEVAMAESTATRALARFEAIRDASGVGEARRVLGIVALRRRALDTARDHLDHALSTAIDVHNPLLAAETREVLAFEADLRGNVEAADRLRTEASTGFAALAAEPWGRRVRARTAVLLLLQV